MGAEAIASFLTWLAVERRVSASTQNQALSALLFLYRHVLQRELADLPTVVRARTPERLPVVLSRSEVSRVLAELSGPTRLIAILLYGAGLRLQECLELRVKDLDFDLSQVTVRQGKGQKDRRTPLPLSAVAPLRAHLLQRQELHARDRAEGHGRVEVPFALERKYPGAATSWAWQFVFPASRICKDPRYGPPSRFHVHESVVQRAVAEAVRRANHPAVKLLVDLFHMLRNGESPDDILKVGPLIRHAHLAENNDRAAPGVNGEDFRPFLRALRKVGYNDRLALEPIWTDLPNQLAPALREVRRQLADAGY